MNFCTKCGASLKEGAQFCSGCGAAVAGIMPMSNATQDVVSFSPPPSSGHLHQQINIVVPRQTAQTTQPAQPVRGQTVRLVVGIATAVLFILLQVHSCVVMGAESIANFFADEQSDSGGATSYFASFVFLIAGIVSIACRKSRGGAFIAGGIYAFCGIIQLGVDSEDLQLYGWLSLVFAVVLIISAIVQRRHPAR